MKLAITVTARGAARPPDVSAAIGRATARATGLVYARTLQLVSGVLLERRTGKLASAVNQKVEKRSRGAIGFVGVDDRAFYARFLDQGTQPHELGRGARLARQRTPRRRAQRGRQPFRGRRAGVMRFTVGGQTLFRSRARHPGVRRRGFMLTAVQHAQPEIQKFFQEEIAKEVQGAAARA